MGGALAGLTLVGAGAPQDIDAQVSRALDDLDVPAVVALWEELQNPSDAAGEAAKQRLLAWREKVHQNLYLESDNAALLAKAQIAAKLFQGEFQSAYLNETASRSLLDLDRFSEAFTHLALAQNVVDGLYLDNPQWRKLSMARVAVERCRLFRRLGILDRAAAETPLLHEVKAQLTENNIDPALLSYIMVTLADLDIALDRSHELVAWLQPEIERGGFLTSDLPRVSYSLAQAIYQSDPEDPAGISQARALFQGLVASESTPTLLRSQSHQRLGRIALNLGEYDRARQQLSSASKLAESHNFAPDEAAHITVFALRVARLSGQDQEPLRTKLLAQWAQLLELWRSAPARAGGVGFLTYKNHKRIIGEVMQVLLETDGPRAAFEQLLAVDRASSLSKTLEASGRAPGYPKVGESEILLAYQPGTHGLHLFVLDQKGLTHHLIESASFDLDANIKGLKRILYRSPRGPASEHRQAALTIQGAKLWDKLIPNAVQDQLAVNQRLTIRSAGALLHLPFECIGPSPMLALGLSHDVAYLPSLALPQTLVTPPSPRAPFALLSGAASFDFPEGWSADLASWYTALDRMAQPLVPNGTLGETQADVVQLIGHGRLDYERELMATIELDGGLVGYQEIIATVKPPALALVTACGTWLGPSRMGDAGAGNIASAFLRRGTQAVVLPATDIEAQATLAWSRVFHWSLGQGASPAHAAREARLALAASERFSDPFYHSLLHVVGSGHQPIFPNAAHRGGLSKPAPASNTTFDWRVALAGAGALLIAFGFRPRRV